MTVDSDSPTASIPPLSSVRRRGDPHGRGRISFPRARLMVDADDVDVCAAPSDAELCLRPQGRVFWCSQVRLTVA